MSRPALCSAIRPPRSLRRCVLIPLGVIAAITMAVQLWSFRHAAAMTAAAAETAVQAPVLTLSIVLGFLAGLMILLATVVVWRVVDRAILRPVEAMRDAVLRRSRGEHGALVPAGAPGELGELARAFDTLFATLGDGARKLAESEDRYRQIFETNAAVKLIVDPDTGRIVDANQAACRFYGYTHEEFLKLTIHDLNMLDRAEVQGRMEQASKAEIRAFVFPHRLASGAMREVEVYSGPITVGGRTLLHSIVHDVTERRRAEEKEREAHANLQAFFDLSGDALSVLDEHGSILLVNRAMCEASGYGEDELLGASVLTLHPSELRPKALKVVADIMAGQAVMCRLPLHTRSGRDIPVETRVVRGGWGGKPALFCITRDVSERERVAGELRQARDQLEQRVSERTAELERSAARVQHLNDVLTALQAARRLMVSEKEPVRLVQCVCETLLETRGYVVVWVGEPDPETMQVRLVAHAGPGGDVFRQTPIRWDDSPSGRGPSGRALRERRAVVFNDIAHHPDFAPWRSPVVEMGAGAVAAFPLVYRERLRGVLTVKADRSDAFDDGEVALLEAMALDLAQALQGLEDERARVVAEQQLRDAHAHLERQVEARTRELRHQTAILASLLHSIPDIVFYKDHQGRYLGCNPEFERLVGVSSEHVTGRTDFDLFPLPLALSFREHDRRVVEGRMARHNEEWAGYPDGRKVLVDTFKAPLVDLEGKLMGVLGVSRDITQRWRTEQEFAHLRRIQDHLMRLATEFVNIPVSRQDEAINNGLATVGVLIGTDRAYVFAYDTQRGLMRNTHEWCAEGISRQIDNLQDIPMESAAAWVAAHQRGEVVQIPVVSEMAPGPVRDALVAQDIQSLVTVPLLEGGECLGFVGFDAVREVRGWRGEEIALLRVLAELFSNLRARSAAAATIERTQAALVTARDELELRVEARTTELRQSEATFRALFETMEQGVVYQGTDGRILGANPAAARLLGVSSDAITRYSWTDGPWEFTDESGARLPASRHPAAVAFAGGTPVHGALLGCRAADGETRWLLVDAVPEYQQDSARPHRVFTTFSDITGRRRLEDQLHQAQKMESVGRLAGGVAHDFNNCMYCINGFSDILLESLPRKSPLRDHVVQIQAAAQQAADTTRQLLAFSRQQAIHPRCVDLNQLIRDQEKMQRRLIGEDIRMELDLSEGPAMTIVDPTQFQQIMLNLSVNARDAMPHGGSLTVSTRSVRISEGPRAGSCVRVSVVDTGSGMSAATRAHIFEPFFTTKGAGKGTGLGLAVVHGIVEQHGGWIDVDSQEGLGTRFDIHFPSADRAADDTRSGPDPSPLPHGKGQVVLLVEDAAGVRRVAGAHLRSLDYRVIEADCLAAARRVLHEQAGAIDLVLSDVVLPDGSGVTLAGEVSALAHPPRLMLTSGYVDDKSRYEEIAERKWPFVMKPYSKRVLAEMVAGVLASEPSHAG